MKNVKLILTHGTTDLQIILHDKQGRRWRAAPEKAIVRRFHQWLLEHREEAEIVPLPSDLEPRESETSFTDFLPDSAQFALWLGEESPDAFPQRNQEGKLQLVVPKIEPALRAWLQTRNQDAQNDNPMAAALRQAGVQAHPLQGVLVLSTDRGDDKDGQQEPIATFTFLQAWFARQGWASFSNVQEAVFLHPGERLEDGQSLVSRTVAERIERAIHNFYNAGTDQDILLIGNIGGIPPIKPLINEIALLVAGDACTENLFKAEQGEAGLVRLSPIDALRTRRQCLEQIRHAGLLEAAIIAAPWANDPDARAWVRPLQEAAKLINGNPIHEQTNFFPALHNILKDSERAHALLVAIRVEAALQNQRWLEAINGSLIFLEAAFEHAIRDWANEHAEEYIPRKRYIHFKDDPPRVLLDGGAIEKPKKPWKKPWYGKEHLPVYEINRVGEEPLQAWSKVLGIPAIDELRKAIHQTQTLSSGQKYRLADYRNFNTHGILTQAEIDEALTRFMGTNLWSQGVNNPKAKPKPGKAFLDRPHIKNVLKHFLGEEYEPLVSFQNLLSELEQRLLDPTTPML